MATEKQITDALFTGIDTLVQNNLKENKIPKIIEAVISKMVDSEVGLYQVIYNNQTLSAYSNNPSIKYSENDIVFVLSQDGTLDGTLIIAGAKSPYSGMFPQENEVENKYIKLVDGFLEVSDNEEAMNLCTYKSGTHEDLDYITIVEQGDFHNLFDHYLQKYGTFCFEFSVKTNIAESAQKVNGDYGFTLSIPLLLADGTDATEEYTIGIDQMTGSPYNFEKPMTQRIYFYLNRGAKFNKDKAIKIGTFINGFNQSEEEKSDDIFLSNASFYPVDVIDASVFGKYYLTLQATQGTLFSSNPNIPTIKTVTPTLYVGGKETSLENIPVYWFTQDPTITSRDTEYYKKEAGVGWKLQSASNNKLEYIVDKNDFLVSYKLKCICIYNRNVIAQEIELVKGDSGITYSFNRTTNTAVGNTSNVPLEMVVTLDPGIFPQGLGDNTLRCTCLRFGENGTYLGADDFYTTETKPDFPLVSGTTYTYKNLISFNSSILNQVPNRIDCTVYLVVNGVSQSIGTKSLVITPQELSGYTVNIENGGITYKYDTNGNSPLCKDFDSLVTDADPVVIQPITYRVYKEDGTELTEDEYAYCKTTWVVPVWDEGANKRTLMNFEDIVETTKTKTEDGNYIIISGNGRFGLNYTLDPTYDINATDGLIRLTVECDREGVNVAKGNTLFTFLKDGEPGTNGTSYAAQVTYLGYTYGQEDPATGRPVKFQLLWDNDDQTTGDEAHRGANANWYLCPLGESIVSKGTGIFTSALLNSPTHGFSVRVSSNGEVIDSTTGLYSVDWSMVEDEFSVRGNAGSAIDNYLDTYFQVDNESGTISPKVESDVIAGWDDPTKVKACILRAKITVSPREVAGTNEIIPKTTLYAYYPIELTYVENLTVRGEDPQTHEILGGCMLPSIIGGFDFVTYNNDCTNPTYYAKNKGIFTLVDDSDTEDGYYEYTWNCSPENLVEVNQNGLSQHSKGFRFKPKDNYKAVLNNYVKVDLGLSETTKANINTKINSLKLEKEELNSMVRYQDDVYEGLKKFGEGYHMSSWYSYSSTLNSASFLKQASDYREQMLKLADHGAEVLEQLDAILPPFPIGGDPDHKYSFHSEYYTPWMEHITDLKKAMKYMFKGPYSEQIDINYPALTGLSPIYFENIIIDDMTKAYGPGNSRQVELLRQDFNNWFIDKYTGLPDFEQPITEGALRLTLKQYVAAPQSGQQRSPGREEFEHYAANYTELTTFLDTAHNEGYDKLVRAVGEATSPFDTTLFRVQALGDIMTRFRTDFINNIGNEEEAYENDLFYTRQDYERFLYSIGQALKEYLNFDGSPSDDWKNSTETNKGFYEELVKDIESQITTLENIKASPSTFVHMKPILFSLNRYGYGFLNDWDGNKLVIDNDGNYIVSPMIGAGRKETDNSFTGILMGDFETANKEEADKVGLKALGHGEQTFFLDANTGKATFGNPSAKSGAIVIDPDADDKAVITSSDFVYDETSGKGMEIVFSEEPSIRFGSGKFEVNSDGHATIKGGGSIAGWEINDKEIYKGKSTRERFSIHSGDSTANPTVSPHISYADGGKNGFLLSPEQFKIGDNFLFKTNGDADPSLYIGNNVSRDTSPRWEVGKGSYLGTVNNEEQYASAISYKYSRKGNATKDDQFDDDSLYIGTNKVQFGRSFRFQYENNVAQLKVGKNIENDKCWTISGGTNDETEYSYIAYNTNSLLDRKSHSVYIGTDGIRLGGEFGKENPTAKFEVTQDGKLTARYGKIADFTLDDDKLYSGNKSSLNSDQEGVYIGKDGIELGNKNSYNNEPKFQVTKNGELTSSSGKIGGWTIDRAQLKSRNDAIILDANTKTISGQGDAGSWSLNGDGSIDCNQINANGGEIGGFTIGNNALYTNGKATINTAGDGVHLSSSGVAVGDAFKVTNDGALTASSGTIGGITLSGSGLSGTGMSISSGGITCSNLTATGGTIGSLAIDADGLSYGNLSIKNSGTITAPNIEVSSTFNHTGANVYLFGKQVSVVSQRVITGITLNADGTVASVFDTTINYLSVPVS